jgi:hypothetical protein
MSREQTWAHAGKWFPCTQHNTIPPLPIVQRASLPIVQRASLMLSLLASASLEAGARTLSPWEFGQAEAVRDLPTGVLSRKGNERLPVVYDFAKIPDKTDSRWKPAPVVNGKINYGATNSSRIPQAFYGKFTKVDFTYFRAFLDLTKVPADFKLNTVTATIGKVDDQARMLLFNRKYPQGKFVPANDGKRGGDQVTTDFTNDIALGEMNTFVVIQVDDNPGGNILNGGITVMVNAAEVKPDLAWPTKYADFMAEPGYADALVVATSKPSSKTSAVLSLSYNLPADAPGITESGLVYAPTATSTDPMIGGNGVLQRKNAGRGEADRKGAAVQPVVGLTPNTAYTVKAYVINSRGTIYSAAKSFTTPAK